MSNIKLFETKKYEAAVIRKKNYGIFRLLM
jgi:hypothetical protein